MGSLTDLGRIIVLIFFFAFLIGYVHASALMFMIALFCLGLILVSYGLARWGAREIECRREMPTSAIFSGDPYNTTIVLRENAARWRWIEIFDQQANLLTGKTTHRRMSVMIEGGASHAVSVFGVRHTMIVQDAARQAELRDVMLFPHRGHYRLGPLKLTSSDMFGICTYKRTFPRQDEVLVYPRPIPMQTIPLAGMGARQDTHVREVLRAGESLDFYGIRPYVQGDDLRRVHWKSTAHTGKLAVKEFEFHTAGGVQLLLDLQRDIHLGQEEFSSLEAGITLAASIVNYVLSNGNQIGLLTTGEHVQIISPDSGSRQMQRTMETLALAENTGAIPLARVLASGEVPSTDRNTLIIITPSTDMSMLAPLLSMKGRCPQVLLFLLDAYSFHQAMQKKERAARTPWAFVTQPIHLSSFSKREEKIPAPDAHEHLCRAACSAGFAVIPVNAELPLHQALQGMRGRYSCE